MIPEWFANPHPIGAVIGMFVLYPYFVWRDGFRHTAAYWLNPMDFSSPTACYLSLYSPPSQPIKNIFLCILGNLIGLFHVFIFGAMVFGTVLILPFLAFAWN